MKANYRHSQLRQSSILAFQGYLAGEAGCEDIDPKIDFKGYSPSNENEELALGCTLKMIHVGASKMVSNAAILENYFNSVEIQKEQFQHFQTLKLVSATFYQIFIFHQMIALQKL